MLMLNRVIIIAVSIATKKVSPPEFLAHLPANSHTMHTKANSQVHSLAVIFFYIMGGKSGRKHQICEIFMIGPSQGGYVSVCVCVCLFVCLFVCSFACLFVVVFILVNCKI